MCVVLSVGKASYDSVTSRSRNNQMFVPRRLVYVRLHRDSSTELVLSPRSLFILTYQAANCTRKTGSRVPRMTITVLVVVEDSVDSHVTVVLVSVNVHNV